MSIRVLLVDDHGVVRSGLSRLIRDQPDMEVVGEAEDAGEAVRRARELTPDIIVLDIGLPDESGLKTIPRLQEVCPSCRVLILSMYDDPAYLRDAMSKGALGYVVKDAADRELIAAIRTLQKGRTYYVVPIDKKSPPPPSLDPEPQALGELSQREVQVLMYVAYGYTSQQIASRLNLATKTVEGYRGRMMDKLGLHSRAELVRYALENGILHPDRQVPGSH